MTSEWAAYHAQGSMRGGPDASPSWNLNADSPQLLADYGFQYDSSLMSHDLRMYWLRDEDRVEENGSYSFGRPTSTVEVPVSWSLDDFSPFTFVWEPLRLRLLFAAATVDHDDQPMSLSQTRSSAMVVVSCRPTIRARRALGPLRCPARSTPRSSRLAPPPAPP